jgi:acyl-CoA dehydrogenase
MTYDDLNMNLGEAELQLKRETNRFAREVMRPIAWELDRMRPEEISAPSSPLWEFMRKAYELGYHKTRMPEKYGGSGLTPLQAAIVIEELSWGSFGLELNLGGAIGTAAFALSHGNKKHIEEFVIPYCECTDGTVAGCLAITEPDRGSDTLLACCPGYPSYRDPDFKGQCIARRKGDGYVINGQKSSWVCTAPIANSGAVWCQVEKSPGDVEGCGIFILPLDIQGVTKGKPVGKEGTRDLAQGPIYFDDVYVPEESLVVGPENCEAVTEGFLCRTLSGVAVRSVGLARAAFEEALNYARERVQGGKLLIEHQSVQAKLFDMFRKVEAGRQLARAAFIYNYTNPSEKRSLKHAAAAKTFASRVAHEVATDAVMIFGTIGMTEDHLIQKLWRDALVTLTTDGSNNSLEVWGGYKVAHA